LLFIFDSVFIAVDEQVCLNQNTSI
jgi:hypothetical protein